MRRFGVFVSASLLLVSTGCRHRPATVIPIAAHAPVALETTAQNSLPPAVASVPTQAPPVASVLLPAKKVRRVHHRSTLPTAAPQASTPVQPSTPSTPIEVASESQPPIASVIGLLTTGEDASPATQQHAADLIASNDKRLKALSPEEVADHRSAVIRVSNFDRDATVALKTGDASGAIILATKAQVLLDDLNK